MNPIGRLFDLEPNIIPVDTQGGANAGDWFSLENYQGIVFVGILAAGVANDDPVFELQQATSNAGANVKDLNAFRTIYRKQGADIFAVTSWTKDTQTADEDYTMNATSAEQQKMVAVYVDAAELDRDGGFNFVQCNIKDTGAAGAQLGASIAILVGPRYQREPEESISPLS